MQEMTVDLLDKQCLSYVKDQVDYLIQESFKKKDLKAARKAFTFIIGTGLDVNAILADHLIKSFALCGSFIDVNHAFSKISNPTIFTWNSIIFAYLKLGQCMATLKIYGKMLESAATPDRVTYLSILQSCGKCCSLNEGRLLHCQVILDSLDSDLLINNVLIDMYGKCKCFDDAKHVFERLSDQSVVSWTAMIGAYLELGDAASALGCYGKMVQEGINPSKVTFLLLIEACGCLENLVFGRVLHDLIIQSGFVLEDVCGSALVRMYARCQSLMDACNVFDSLLTRDIVSWGALMCGFVHHDDDIAAIRLFDHMQYEGLKPDKFIFSCVLKACARAKTLEQGRRIYELVVNCRIHKDLVVGTALIDMFSKCGCLERACKVFDELPNRNAVSWGAIIKGCIQHKQTDYALQLLKDMYKGNVQANECIFECALKICASLSSLSQGRLVHDQILRCLHEFDTIIGTTLIDFYANCGSLDEARCVFNTMQDKDLLAWGTLIEGYLCQQEAVLALEVYTLMESKFVKADAFILMCVLQASCQVQSSGNVRYIHDQIIRNGLDCQQIVGNTLIDSYGKCGCQDEATKVFLVVQNRDIASWTAMIGGYAQHGEFLRVFEAFKEMQEDGFEPTEVTYLCILKACSDMNDMRMGYLIHNRIIRSKMEANVTVINALIDMYAKCGSIHEARRLFDGLAYPDPVSWGTMVAACAQHGYNALALETFAVMQGHGLSLTKVLALSIIKACGDAGALCSARLLHDFFLRNGFEFDAVISCCLIDMYAKCGSPRDGHKVFGNKTCNNIVSCGALIAGYGYAGNYKQAKECFNHMHQRGSKLNNIIFTNIMSACGHMGYLQEGFQYFNSLEGYNETTLHLEHFGCMIDLLARSGRLNEAWECIQAMPLAPDPAVWRSLLASCRHHGHFMLGRDCFDQIFNDGCTDASACMLMSNICMEMQMWESTDRMQMMLEGASLNKKLGVAWIEVGAIVYEFVVGAKYQPGCGDLWAKWRRLMMRSKESGLMPHVELVDSSLTKNIGDSPRKQMHTSRVQCDFKINHS